MREKQCETAQVVLDACEMLTKQPTNQATNQPTNQPTNHLISQSTNQLSFCHNEERCHVYGIPVSIFVSFTFISYLSVFSSFPLSCEGVSKMSERAHEWTVVCVQDVPCLTDLHVQQSVDFQKKCSVSTAHHRYVSQHSTAQTYKPSILSQVNRLPSKKPP